MGFWSAISLARDRYCTTCGTADRPKVITRGSILVEIILWSFLLWGFVFPPLWLVLIAAVVYSLWRLTSRFKACRACGSRDIMPLDAPKAREEMAVRGHSRLQRQASGRGAPDRRGSGEAMGTPKRIAVPEDASMGEVNVVGESHYQENLEAICGGRTEEGEERNVEAVLILDDKNRFDRMAVRVEIQGKTVGHLDRQAAREYREWLAEIGYPGVTAIWDAVIRGGWDRGKGDRGHYGVSVYIGSTEAEEREGE